MYLLEIRMTTYDLHHRNDLNTWFIRLRGLIEEPYYDSFKPLVEEIGALEFVNAGTRFVINLDELENSGDAILVFFTMVVRNIYRRAQQDWKIGKEASYSLSHIYFILHDREGEIFRRWHMVNMCNFGKLLTSEEEALKEISGGMDVSQREDYSGRIFSCPRCTSVKSLMLSMEGENLVARCAKCGLDSAEGEHNGVRYLAWRRAGIEEIAYICGIPVHACTGGGVEDYLRRQGEAVYIDLPRAEGAWVPSLERVGYSGFRKKRLYRERDECYGEGNWKVCHVLGGIFLDMPEALALYEAAYVRHFIEHPEDLDRICLEACDVYDYSPDNVRCALSYDMDGEKANHYQDVAVRRTVMALGKRFEGANLVQIRGRKSTGYYLNPGKIAFQFPGLIRVPELCAKSKGGRIWWEKGSVESFWQNNKVLLYLPSV